MPRVNVWIPDSLYTQAKEAGINVSAAAQYGISVKLGNAETIQAAAKPFTGEGVISAEQAQTMARDLLAKVQPSIVFPELPRPEGDPCPHPAKERTSYGVCRLCKQKVQP